MNKTYRTPTDKLLLEYSALTEYWDDNAGDTHELLGGRELLADRDLTAAQRAEMERVDSQVLALVAGITTETWDTLMLQKTAELIQSEQSQLRKTA